MHMDRSELHSDDPIEPWVGGIWRPIDVNADRKLILGQIDCPACDGRGEFDDRSLGPMMLVYAVAPAECLLCGHRIEPRT